MYSNKTSGFLSICKQAEMRKLWKENNLQHFEIFMDYHIDNENFTSVNQL